MKRLCVIHGQGGGMDVLILKKLKERIGESMESVALSVCRPSVVRAINEH